MQNPAARQNMDWTGEVNYPRADYLSSSRKRLAPQLMYKGGILNTWGKKMAVVLHSGFYATLPQLQEVGAETANVAWLVYDLDLDAANNRRKLTLARMVHTDFGSVLARIAEPEPGPVEAFIEVLQDKLDEKLEDQNAPDAPTISEVYDA